MWLINTSDYTLHEVYDPGEDHPYAILSHTWEESKEDPFQKEVTFHDMRDLNEARKKIGWAKIERTCDLAIGYEPSLKWAWIDTCCIDKSSSAELTEAINSMFSWYKRARVCFVFLNDLPPSPTENPGTKNSRDHMNVFFPKCRWFTRGWTLQELIAPNEMEFYDTVWKKRGTKTDLKEIISSATGVDQAVLDDSRNMPTIPVGRRMSWVSKRTTKRIEDIAYCLFGIFDVNMPLIYGEGDKAFIRLQTAIAQQINDLSLFAWSIDSDSDGQDLEVQAYYGIFAPSYRYFKCCNHLFAFRDPQRYEQHSFAVTNRGLEFQLRLNDETKEGNYIVNLCCQGNDLDLAEDESKFLVIQLVRTLTGFVRHNANKVLIARDIYSFRLRPGKRKAIHVPMVVSPSESHQLEARLQNAFRFRVQSPSAIHVKLICSLGVGSRSPKDWEVIPEGSHAWNEFTTTFLTGSYPMFTGLIWPRIFNDEKDIKWPHALRIVFGFNAHLSEKRNSVTEPAVGLRPWAAVIADVDDCINIDGLGAARSKWIFLSVKRYIEQKEPYGSAVSTLGYLIRETADGGSEMPKSAILTPYKIKSSSSGEREKQYRKG